MEKPIVYNIEPTKLFMNPIRIIDTPGFIDVRGIHYDKKIIDDIKNLLQGPDIKSINAICMFNHASDTRPKYLPFMMNYFTSLFGKEIINNIIFIFTFAYDWERMPALAMLKDKNNYFYEIFGEIEKIPYFQFDNHVYLERNSDDCIYERNNKSFINFLKYIISLKRAS